ncbi:hypothetical protein FHS49_001391 [Sphingobium boeckii]|uniref:Uncharacterized protein n=2 Tax=Sphingobium boeckii TaxID=1082345 RepID=A0A7W9EDK4_9SPHN|nr:hypothetical protein [Sphingobium boeckii]
MFTLELEGQAAPVDSLLQWTAHARLGVVMIQPFGALGASLAIQLAIASYGAVEEARRMRDPHYAEIYLFHVGGRWGDFSLFDFWPARREIFLPDDPCVTLASLNSHGITHLLVPDGAPTDIAHDFKEPEAAMDRLALCLAYDPSGAVRGADVVLSSSDPAVLENLRDTLWPGYMLEEPVDPARRADPARLADHMRWRAALRARLDEVGSAEREPAETRANALLESGKISEQYRRVSPAWALQRLGRR